MRNEHQANRAASEEGVELLFHPGPMMWDALESIGLCLSEAAARINVTPDRLEAVLDGRAPLDTFTAESLASLFGTKFVELALRWQIANDQALI